jgi:hypothetical protein
VRRCKRAATRTADDDGRVHGVARRGKGKAEGTCPLPIKGGCATHDKPAHASGRRKGSGTISPEQARASRALNPGNTATQTRLCCEAGTGVVLAETVAQQPRQPCYTRGNSHGHDMAWSAVRLLAIVWVPAWGVCLPYVRRWSGAKSRQVSPVTLDGRSVS